MGFLSSYNQQSFHEWLVFYLIIIITLFDRFCTNISILKEHISLKIFCLINLKSLYLFIWKNVEWNIPFSYYSHISLRRKLHYWYFFQIKFLLYELISRLCYNQTYFRLLARFLHLGGCVTHIQVVDRKIQDHWCGH